MRRSHHLTGLGLFGLVAMLVPVEVVAAPALEERGPVVRPPEVPEAMEIGNVPDEALPESEEGEAPSAEDPKVVPVSESDATAADPQLDHDPVKVDGKKVGDIDDIEDVGLEGLLGMDLGDQMGTTEAASDKEEDALSAPATLTMMDADEIRLSGATTIPDLLRFIPGVDVVQAAPGVHYVSIRGTAGLTNNNIVVMVDGVPFTDVVDGSVNWDLVPVDVPDIERIEVVRGPVSPVYGANAYTGVINIVTRDVLGLSPDWRVRGVGGADLTGSPYGIGSAGVAHVTKNGTRLKLFVVGGQDALYRNYENGSHVPNNKLAYLGHVDGHFAKHGFYSLQVGGGFSSRSSLDLLTRESEWSSRQTSFGRFGIGVRGIDGPFDTFEFWVRDRGGWQAIDRARFNGFTYGDSFANRAESGVDLNFDLHEAIELHGGVSGTWDYIGENEFLDPAVAGSHFGAGYRIGLRLEPSKKWIFGVDLRGDQAPTMKEVQESVRLSGVYHRDNWALRAALATAFRAPSYVEAGGQFADPGSGFVLLEGDPNLRPPTSRAAEFGAILAPRSDLTIAPTIYVAGLQRSVVTDFEPLPRKSFRNDEHEHAHVGGEFELTWRKSDALHLIGMVAGQYWLGLEEHSHDHSETGLTVGVAEQNARVTGGVRAYGMFLNETMGYGVGARVASGRHYVADAGIPLEVVDIDVPMTSDLDGMIERRLHDKFPLWLSLRARSTLFLGEGDRIEAPFNNGTPRGTSVMLGLEYRGR